MASALVAMMAAFGFTALQTPSAQASPIIPEPTIVTFTFDDSWKDQAPAFEVLAKHGMNATLYTISQRLDNETALSVTQLKKYAVDGFEIAGHTLTHPYLTRLSAKRATHEICDDRATLMSMGFKVTGFAYPHGDQNVLVRKIVKKCGYDNARSLPGLRSPGYGCYDCAPAETVPPLYRYRIRTPTTVRRGMTVQILKQDVLQVEKNGGGWMPLVFHHICNDCADNAMSLKDFTTFVDWLGHRPTTTEVKTVDQVMQGPVKPAVGQVVIPPDVREADQRAAALRSGGKALPPNQPASTTAALSIGGIHIGQAQIMFVGVLMGLTAILTYRAANRRDRRAR